MHESDLGRQVRDAAERLRGRVRETPVDASPELTRRTGARVFLKLENIQHTGSFKLRGTMNKLLSLATEERRRGVVAASTGNHGAATAYACHELGIPCRVFVPEGASESKLDAIRSCGAEIESAGNDGVVSERTARAYAAQHGLTYVSPYNDATVVAGQGTIGEELSRQVGKIDAIFISLGGGGLLSGVAGFLRTVDSEVEVVACSARNSAVMYESLLAGEILDLESLPTLSDGTAGGVEEGAITFPLCQALIDRHALVEEEEIAAALRLLIERQHLLVEGSAAMAVAALLQSERRYEGRTVVVLLCGGNITLETLRKVIDG
jgi:threonine dehydratase